MHSSNSRDSLLSRGDDSFCCMTKKAGASDQVGKADQKGTKLRTLIRLKTVIGAP